MLVEIPLSKTLNAASQFYITLYYIDKSSDSDSNNVQIFLAL